MARIDGNFSREHGAPSAPKPERADWEAVDYNSQVATKSSTITSNFLFVPKQERWVDSSGSSRTG